MSTLVQNTGRIRLARWQAQAIFGLLISLFASSVLATAEMDSPASLAAQKEHFFSPGQIEGSFGSGVIFTPFVATRGRPTFNFTTASVQAGVMLTPPQGKGLWRGNFEPVFEGFAGGVFKGRGHYLAGSTIWLRYNFVPPQWRITPYAQLGAGGLVTDMDRRIVGQAFQFNLDAGFGARYFVKPNLSFNFEYRFQHISNADTGPHNLGLNGHGPFLGLSWLF